MRPPATPRSARGRAAAVALAALLAAVPARATLDEPGFRAVGVALARHPISALAVAPDGRLFAAVQALGRTFGDEPGDAEIRVYGAYATNDGAVLDEGAVWATVTNVRATNAEEGLLGIALAPDFATSKLVYVYLTTTDEEENHHVRVYRENAAGVGEYLGAVQTTLEPENGSSVRNGGGLAFGVDGCLYVGLGDDGSGARWNAQLLEGTNSISSSESNALCTAVCTGTEEYPERTGTNDGMPNHAGKVLRLAVEGPSPAQPAAGAALAAQPRVFAAGLRDPVGFAVHPLTGQLYVAERGNNLEAEIDIADNGSNQGWPCLEGTLAASAGGVAPCLSGSTADDVYANHPAWRRPVATHTGNPATAGLAAYTGLAYPAEFYGDVFYVLRDGARIYRIDLEPPCFLPHPGGVVPTVFHDSNNDGDFRAIYDRDDDGDFETVTLATFTSLVEASDPLGRRVLYVAGKQSNSSNLTDDSVVFRIEYATAVTPWAGPTGRVDDSCFAGGVYSGGSGPAPYAYENPFQRPTCLPPGGPCPGQPDGAACDNGNACDGPETCRDGVCQHGTRPGDGTACESGVACRDAGTCAGTQCVPGPALADGTPCPDGDPCNGFETCAAGTCQAGSGPLPLSGGALTVKVRPGRLGLAGTIQPPVPLAPSTRDGLTVELRDASTMRWAATLSHPEHDAPWRGSKPPRRFRYRDRRGAAGGLTSVDLRGRRKGRFRIAIKGRGVQLGDLADPALDARLIVGDQCFQTSLACKRSRRALRCR